MDINSNNKSFKIMDQLIEGQELTIQLQQLFSQSQTGSSTLGQVEDLLTKILGTFTNSISAIDSCKHFSSSSLAAVEGSQNASCDNDGKFEDSGDSRKRFGPVKGKRGCYKRKKRSETWTVVSTRPDDEYSWRKYGQKEILNSKFPRSYFRCTHKYTKGCKATKQVQKVELEAKMLNITYIGHHTCNTNEESPKIKPCDHDEILIDSDELKSPSLMNQHGSSTEKDLSLVWTDMVFEDDHHHHETIASINVLYSTDDDLMFGTAVSDLGFSDNENLSIFDSCSSLD